MIPLTPESTGHPGGICFIPSSNFRMASPAEMVFENCKRCEFPILQTKYIAAEGIKWHADCFVCKNCEKPFENDQYIIHGGDVFCEEDYQLQFAKKCDRCGGAISDKCISALDLEWHPECFTCDSCANTLAGGSFMKKNGRPYCKTCHGQQKFAALALQKNLCNRCKKPILDTMLVLKGERYHASHFACAMCKCNLKQDCREFEGKLFCPKCFERVNNPTCVVCQDIIYGRCVTALGKTYHPDHLRCFKCQIMLPDGIFYDHLGEPHCEYHYHDARGDLCGRCFQPATGQVLNAANSKWCREHFLCACCDKNLTETKYVDWDLKPVCKDCYNHLGHDLRKRLEKYRDLEAKVEELRKKMASKKTKA